MKIMPIVTSKGSAACTLLSCHGSASSSAPPKTDQA